MHEDTVTFTGLTAADLADLRVRVTIGVPAGTGAPGAALAGTGALAAQPGLGSVTSPSGTVKSLPMTGLVDAACYAFSSSPGPPPQWQHLALASDHGGVCADAGGSFRPGEITFRLVMIGVGSGHPTPVFPPPGDLPITFAANGTVTGSDGVQRTCQPLVMQAKANGTAGTDTAATGGTVTITKWDAASGVAASWDLSFGSDHTTGSMTAPWCGTPPDPLP
jgi:hypothetical protein